MIYKRELRKNVKSLLIWSVILCGLILMSLSIYPQFTENKDMIDELLQAYPEPFKEAFGMNDLDFGSLLGFYGVEIHFMVALLGSIYAVMLASNILSKEENEKTIEFLLSKPITRSQILTEKLGAVLTHILIFNLLIMIVSLIGFQFSSEDYALSTFLFLILGTVLMHLTFAALAFLLSSFMRKSRTITAVSLGLVLISYFLSIVSGMTEQLEGLKYLSLFKYVDAADIIKESALSPLYAFLMLVVIAASIGLTYSTYRKKDIAV
ncbi:ABC transporter permease subunit [Marinicrinis sediminis]|uniref:ABC transporter permease subunit n=1 Tax=Marinicrinis sediminis TaxID=1652465 RepID=A0ABW5RAB3_9BACL